MSYESTLSQLMDIYHDSEKQFLEFSEIIPFIDNPWYVYSPRLYGMLHLMCSQVDALFPLVGKKLNLNPTNDDLNGWYNAINRDGILEDYKLVLEKNRTIIQPYSRITQPVHGNNLTFGWWFSYNGSKHGFPEGIKFATVGNIIHALASAYILHEIAYHAKYWKPDDLLNGNNWRDENTDFIQNPSLLRSFSHVQEKISSRFFVNFRKFWVPSMGA